MDKKIGHYEIVSELGRGGMGVVYKAHEQSLNRFVAIKMLGEHLEEDSAYVQRFVREAQSAAKLNHPNIVQIYAISESEGRHYFVMEYVTGTSLHRVIRTEGRLPMTRAARIVLQTAAGLAAAHEVGIIHRDIKPANILITEKGLVKIADFGLALAAGGASRLTATGMFMGTPGYLSPEQCLDKAVDARTDIYSLGITLFEMLTGAIPFTADSPLALLRQIIDVEPPDVRELNPQVDEASREILLRMIAKDPDQRYPSCDELIVDLQSYLDRAGVSTHDLAAIAAGTAPLAAAAMAATPPPPPPQAPIDPAQGAATELLPEAVTPPPRPVPRKNRTGLILAAVAAVILLALVGGAAVAWQTGFLPRLIGRGGSPVAVAAGELTDEQRELGTRAPAELSAAPAGDEMGDGAMSAPTTDELAAGEPATPADSSTAAAHASAGSTAMLEDSDPGTTLSRAPSASAGTGRLDTHDPGTTRSAAGEATGAPAMAAPQGAPERSAKGAVRAPVASSAQQPRDLAQQPPRPRGVIVVAVGERLLAGQAEAYVERQLQRNGALVVNEARFPEVLDLLTQSDPPIADLLEQLRGSAARLVVVHAEYLGERPLLHYGGRDVVYQSRLRIQAFNLGSGAAVGNGYDENIEYNQLTVERKTEEALRRHLRRMADQLGGN